MSCIFYGDKRSLRSDMESLKTHVPPPGQEDSSTSSRAHRVGVLAVSELWRPRASSKTYSTARGPASGRFGLRFVGSLLQATRRWAYICMHESETEEDVSSLWVVPTNTELATTRPTLKPSRDKTLLPTGHWIARDTPSPLDSTKAAASRSRL